MEEPFVIVLNGVGGVGKTSTAKALQQIVRRPLLHQTKRDLHTRLGADGAETTAPSSGAPDFAGFRCRDSDGRAIETYWKPQPA